MTKLLFCFSNSLVLYHRHFLKENVVLQTIQLNKNLFLTDVFLIERSEKLFLILFKKTANFAKQSLSSSVQR